VIKISKSKSRKQKQEEYDTKYSNIPLDYKERLSYMCDIYNLSDAKMQEIILKRNNMLYNLQYYDLDIVTLYEEPEGTQRSRFRLINRTNFNKEALSNSAFVHVYSPNAKDDFLYMKRLMGEELIALDSMINTPCNIEYNAYFKTPSYLNTVDTFLAEIGIIRPPIDKPDWDNTGKKYCDMYNHNVWLDDSLVQDGSVHKYYSILPRVEIKLRYLNCIYNKVFYNKIIERKDYDNGYIRFLNSKGEFDL
jgi:Holliday junction resolvase RusA-like endonuclease